MGGRKGDAKDNLQVSAWSNWVVPFTVVGRTGGKSGMGRKITTPTLDILSVRHL